MTAADTQLSFEWDDAKARSKLAKHAVPFEVAARVFLDPWIVEFDDSKSQDREVRWKAVGRVEGRLFTVFFTRRAGNIRMISARRSSHIEARHYDPLST